MGFPNEIYENGERLAVHGPSSPISAGTFHHCVGEIKRSGVVVTACVERGFHDV